tara:strand:+ start:130 stop:555 length:426 start_codon:yes stop_codon:yes gene_type:complete
MALQPRITDATGTLDLAGMGLSILCLVHCLAFPVAAAFAPLILPGLADILGASHAWHFGLLALAAPVSLLALALSMREKDTGWPVMAAGLTGLALMLIGALNLESFAAETALTLIGVTILAGAHLVNFRARSRRLPLQPAL